MPPLHTAPSTLRCHTVSLGKRPPSRAGAAFYHFCNTAGVTALPGCEETKMLINTFVIFRIDYSN